MEESAMNLRRSLSILNNNLYGGGAGEGFPYDKYHQNWYRSRLFSGTCRYVSYPSPLQQQPLLPLPFSASTASNSATLLPKKKKKSVKKRRMKSCRKATAKAVDAKEEEEEVIVLSPPPSSLPLPRRLLLTRTPKATSCSAEADSGAATDDLRRLLRL